MYRVPKFLSNTILRGVDLQALNENIKHATFLQYINYDDGVIEGLDVYTDGEKIHVEEGIYKHDGDVYLLNKRLSLDVPEYDGDYYLHLININQEEEYSINKISYLKLYESESVLNEGIELARFHIREGATLKDCDYETKKFNVEFNTLNLLETRYSKTGINPKFLKVFSEKMLSLKLKDAFDLFISSMCMIGLINKELLIKYVSKKLNIEDKKYKNSELLKYMNMVLDNIKDNTNDEDLNLDDYSKIKME